MATGSEQVITDEKLLLSNTLRCKIESWAIFMVRNAIKRTLEEHVAYTSLKSTWSATLVQVFYIPGI